MFWSRPKAAADGDLTAVSNSGVRFVVFEIHVEFTVRETVEVSIRAFTVLPVPESPGLGGVIGE